MPVAHRLGRCREHLFQRMRQQCRHCDIKCQHTKRHQETCCRILWGGNIVPPVTRDRTVQSVSQKQRASSILVFLAAPHTAPQSCSFTSTNTRSSVTNVSFLNLDDEWFYVSKEECSVPLHIFNCLVCLYKAGRMD